VDKTAIKNFINKMSEELPHEIPKVLPEKIQIIIDYGYREILVGKTVVLKLPRVVAAYNLSFTLATS
jgi:hypothetical protein